MNKLFTKIASLTLGLAMAVGVGVAVGSAKASEAKADSFTSTFTDKNLNVGEGELEWTATIAASSFESADQARGVQFGAAKGQFSLNSKSELNNITEVSMVVSTNGTASANTVAVSVGGKAFTCGGNTSYALPKENGQNVSFTGSSSGQITISVNDTNKSVYFKSITVVAGSAPVPVETHDVIFNANGDGVTNMPENLKDQSGVVPLGNVAQPLREGYTFKGWSLTADGDVVSSVTIGKADVNVYAIWESTAGGTVYTLHTGELVEGDYLVVYENGAMKASVASNRLQYEGVVPSDKTITSKDSSIVWHLAKDGNYWTLFNETVKSYAGSTGAKNQAALLGSVTDNAKWTVTGNETYDFENLARGSSSTDPDNKWLRKNSTYGFACYKSDTGGALSLYRDNGSTPPTPVETWNVINNVTNAASLSVTTVAKGGNLSTTIVPETGYTVPESVTVTIGGQAVDYTYANGVVGVQGVSGDVTISGQCVKSEGHAGTKDDPFTVAEGIAKCQEIGQTASGDWYVKGIISQVTSTAEDATKYKNATFNMSDDGLDKNVLIAFRVKYINGADFTADNFKELKVGYTAVVHGALVNYKGNTPEFNGDGNSSLVSLTAPTQPTITLNTSSLNLIENGSQESVAVSYDKFSVAPTISVEGQPAYVTCTVDGYTVKVSPKAVGSEDVTIKATSTANEVATATLKVTVLTEHGHIEKDPYTVAEALKAEVSNGVYIKGVISQIDEVSVDHGNATYFISDDGTTTSQFKVFRGKYLNGENFTSEDQIKVGANVVVTGNMTVYNDENQLANGNYLVSYSEATTQYLVTFAENGTYFADMHDAGEQITIANYHEDLVPDGKSFDHWENEQKVSYQPGDKYTVNGAVTFTAVYVDSDWSSSFKSAFQQKFNVSYPPYINAEFAKEENIVFAENEKLCTISVSGDHVNEVKAKYVNWTSLGKTNDGQDLYKHPTADLYMSVSYVQETVVKFQVKKGAILDASSVKKDFYVGDSLDTTGLKVFYTLVDGSYSENLPVSENSWSASPSKFNTAGNVDVTVTVTGLASPVELKYQVVVLAVQVAKIEISGAMIKTSYTTEDNWNPNGFIVLATYNNGSKEYVTSNVQWSYSPEKPTAGVKLVTATASFGGVSASKDTAVTIYEVYKAENFAEDFLALVAPICNNYDGKTSNKEALKSVWYTMAERYNVLDNDEKVKVIKSASKVDGTALERAMAFYDYACKKYGLKPFVENRTINSLVFETQTSNSILPIIVIVVASLAAVTSIGLIIAYKRRKNLYMK